MNLQENIRKILLQESLKQTLMDEIIKSGIRDTGKLLTVHARELLHMAGIKGTQEDMIFLIKVIMENEVKEQLKYCSYDILPTQHSINIYVYIPKPLPTQSGVWVYDKKVRDDAEELVRYVLYKLGGGLIRGHNVYVYNTGDC